METLIYRLRPFAHGPLVLMLATAAICTACGGQQVITGRPPFISISDMRLADTGLTTEFRVENQNGVAMNVEAIDITVAVDDVQLTGENRELRLAIDANSAEEIRLEEQPDDEARGLLNSLDRQDATGLAFQLSGRVLTQEDGYLRFDQKGHLYPVPGRPGSFRSAVTQAQGLRRDEKL